MKSQNSYYRSPVGTIVITAIAVFLLGNFVSVASIGLLSKDLFRAPLILTFVIAILGMWYLNDEKKKSLGWGMLLGVITYVAFWIYFFVTLASGDHTVQG
ncbi:MAG TPA: hypothetical protein VL728_12725 [Cyclobacteriaceae bacterium]|jgi:hypothetical protein|nr:hypothetical protein [Cyclobacteriaceae bacterium]